MGISWGASIISPLVYCVSMFVIGDLLINSVGEQIGPVTDMVITSLVLLVSVYTTARRSEEGIPRFWAGLVSGGLCFVAQLVLSAVTVGIGFNPLVIQTVLFSAVALVGGFAAQRL